MKPYFTNSLTVSINITSQTADYTIPQYVTLSRLCITNATVWYGGTSPTTGKERVSEAAVNDAVISFQTKGNRLIHKAPLQYLKPNTTGIPAIFPVDRADIQEAVISLNTQEAVVGKVIEITFFYID